VICTKKGQKILILGAVVAAAIIISTILYLPAQQVGDKKVKVVVTFYPLAFFTEEIGGQYVSVTQLIPNNTDTHSWEPSVSHIAACDDADIIVYNGAGLDHWMGEVVIPALTDVESKILVNTTNGISLLGSQDADEPGFDPHTWVCPFFAKQQTQRIFEALVQKDPAHESYYTERWNTLRTQLENMDSFYIQGIANRTKNVIFVVHATAGYLAGRYGFEQCSVIGMSEDQQPSALAIANLVDLMIEHETYVFYVTPLYAQEYAPTIKTELESRAGHPVQILTLYHMDGPASGKDYFAQMQANLENLKMGLGAS
jgi:zinc transport system substrate-binding protein